MKYFSVVFFPFITLIISCTSESNDLHMISDDELMQQLNDTNVVILDVRTQDEYDQGHIAHARLVDVYDDNFKLNVKAFNRAKTYVLYCASSGRASKAARIMMQDGFPKVYDLKYGYNHWKGAIEK